MSANPPSPTYPSFPDSPPANYNDTINDGDPPMTDTSFMDATLVLILPFILIPLSIIVARLIKYTWKIYQARKYGYGDDILHDPLAELGLKVRRGFDATADIRKLRKEKNRLKKEAYQRRASRNREDENDRILNPGTRIGDFVPIHAAAEYLKQVREQTKKTWFELLSPDAVRNWVNVSTYARIWMMLQVFCTFLSIVNYVALTYLANNDEKNERTLIKNLDLGYACFFLLDYCLSFYIAEDRLQFYLNGMSMVDLVSIVSPFVYVFVASPTKYIWFIGFIRIFRSTRILRTYRLLSFTQSEETRELTIFTLNFLNFIFFSASIINATEALNFTNDPPSLQNWHDSLYYIMVTFSTIGFGDLTPSSTASRVVVMFLIVLVVIYIPWQTGKILEIFNSMNKYQRASYTLKAETSHIILTGQMNYSSIIDFCREFFMADDSSSVIIMDSGLPDLSLRRLLHHPSYRSRLSYLQGDQMSSQDLNRAKAGYATAMFVLTADSGSGSNEELETVQSYENDTQILLRTLYAKTTFPGLPIFAQVNDYRSKELASHCGVDRIVCIDQIKATLFASNCLCPGIQTLILNLIHSYKDVDSGSIEFWTQEYQVGLVNQIQSFRIPKGLVGLRFAEAAMEVFGIFNCMIFALASINSGNTQNEMRFLIDRDYKLKVDDVAFCIGEGTDELLLRIALHFKVFGKKDDYETKDLEIEMDKIRNPTARVEITTFEEGAVASPSNVAVLISPWTQHESYSPKDSSNFTEVSLGQIPENLEGHIIVAGQVSSRVLLQFVKSIRERKVNAMDGQKVSAAHKDSPIVIILESLPDVGELGSAWHDILLFHSVYVFKGRAVQRIILKGAHIDRCDRIVIFSKQGQESNSSDAQSVFLVKLLQKEWPHVKFLVELIDGSNVKYLSSKLLEWDTNNLRMQSILNNYALSVGDRQSLYRQVRMEGLEKTTLIYQAIQFLTEKPENSKGNVNGSGNTKKIEKAATRKRDEIQKSARAEGGSSYQNLEDDQEDSSSNRGGHKKEVVLTEVYLQRALEQAELNNSGLSPYPIYHFDKYFAAGMVASSSFMQSLTCQSYFRPFIIEVVRGLISHTYTISIKESAIGKTYLDLVNACLSQGLTPIGLLRNGKSTSPDSLPYVYTNPRQGDIILEGDKVFVIKNFN